LLALGLAIAVRQYAHLRWKAVVFAAPLAAIFALAGITRVGDYPRTNKTRISEVADWAGNNTWGSSVFLFPDAGRDLYPGIFRAESRRAVWVDWESGEEVKYFESAANEWWERWRATMDGVYSTQRLQSMLPLPIDYYVLRRKDQLAGIKPAFANQDFVVYEAQALRSAPNPLHPANRTGGS
jgi:hypothetical protein